MASEVKATYLTASGTVFAGRARIKAIHYMCGSSPSLVLKNKDANGDTFLIFPDGCYVVLSNITNVTVFYN